MSSARLPLNAFRAFEATARLGSMSAAASELGVTHGAISRHIKLLEDQFGLALLRRLPHAVEATAEGARLATTLAEAFNLIHLGVSRLKPSPLTLSCSATIMMYWLIPRLGDFKQKHPDVELRLNVNYGGVDLGRDEISVAIRNSMYQPADDMVVRPMVNEEIGPVCHPDYAARIGIAGPEDFLRAHILETATRPNAWAQWAQAIGRPDLEIRPHDRYEHFYLVIQAAACALGVAMVPRLLVQGEIASGHLVAPCDFVAGPHQLSLWIAPHLRHRGDLRKLVDWLLAEMRKSVGKAAEPAAVSAHSL